MESNILYWVVGAVGGFMLMAVEVLLMRALFRTPPPHRLLVVSGRQYSQGGKTRGFAVHGRTRVVLPVVERAEELDVTCLPCTVEVNNAYLKGGVPVTARWFALVRISREPGIVHLAVEHFLGRPAPEVGQAATETLEGVARGLLAKTEFEAVEDLGFLQELTVEAGNHLRKLGLELVHVSLDSARKGV